MEGAEYPPMRMRTNGVIFDGGHLLGPWVPAEANMRDIEGRIFYAIKKSDRQFAKAMGLNVQSGSPWVSAPVLTYITGVRNKAIDDAIAKADADDDPTAEDEMVPRNERRRPRYERCGAVPSVLEITIPQMERDGQVVGPHVMNVASTANYGFVLEFELTVANVEYLYNAFAASPPSYFDVVSAARKKRRCFKMKPMYEDTPDVVERLGYYGSRATMKPLACTKYTDINGKQHQHSRVINVVEEHLQLGIAEQKRREVALAVQTFKNENHYDVAARVGVDAKAAECGAEEDQ